MEPAVPVPDPAPPEPASRSVIPFAILAGIVVALVIVGILTLQLLNRPASAQDVATDFVVAVYEGDAERACLLTAPAMRQAELDRFDADDCAQFGQIVDPSGQGSGAESADVEVLEITEYDDQSSVRVSSPRGTPGVWTRVDLERLEGEWLVTDYSG
ncbi:hypothetical protein MWU75_09440 [Ornithinimicrobium sp. F0845]|uniref:hypothetical protein n=1 Tax=Ornithinimicrobium sp. F0845 TaxID=2926412 RepID=UPI001FF25D2D|nr:hypothetical protein [Ornithinimicrobium sp. F0845]MCK0112358.1 hypothetical protein [Ornithinimicrobium sp. F0845]